MLTTSFIMRASGSKQLTIPKGYKYMSIENPTAYNINVYSDLVSQDLEHRIMYIPIYTNLPVALETAGLREQQLMIVWTGVGEDKFIVKLSTENLGTGQSLVAPGGSSSVMISSDGVGLAKQIQLPVALTGLGDLKVAVLETVGLEIADLNVDGSKNIGVNIQNTPHVIVDSVPTHAVTNANLDATISSLITAVNTINTTLLGTTQPKACSVGIASTAQVSVLNTATILFNGVVNGDSITIENNDGSTALYIGNSSGVTTSTGFKIPANGVYAFDIVSGSSITIYGIAASTINVGTMVLN